MSGCQPIACRFGTMEASAIAPKNAHRSIAVRVEPTMLSLAGYDGIYLARSHARAPSAGDRHDNRVIRKANRWQSGPQPTDGARNPATVRPRRWNHSGAAPARHSSPSLHSRRRASHHRMFHPYTPGDHRLTLECVYVGREMTSRIRGRPLA